MAGNKSKSSCGASGMSLIIFAMALVVAFAQQDSLEALTKNIPGTPGDDYPIFAQVPETNFLCSGLTPGGYYADPESDCQAFHICVDHSRVELVKYSFLCPNGTVFNQEYFICDWWFNVDCSQAESFYSLNELNRAEAEAASAKGQGQGSLLRKKKYY